MTLSNSGERNSRAQRAGRSLGHMAYRSEQSSSRWNPVCLQRYGVVVEWEF